MTDIPKALEKAGALLGWNSSMGWIQARENVARFIADVSEKAAAAERWALFEESQPSAASALAGLRSLILPDPESDLLKEAREIAKIGGYEEDEGVVQIILVALKRKDG